MKIKSIYNSIKEKFNKRKKLIVFLSLLFTLLFAVYNRVIGALKGSLWHESISIYYLCLVVIKTIIYVYIYKSKDRLKDKKIFIITKILLIILNILLMVPITLLVLNKRTVEMSLTFSIAVAVYVCIKTIKAIINFTKQRKTNDPLIKELRIIDLTDMVVSILTLQNTLISINGGFSEELYIITIVSSFVGFVFNIVCVCLLSFKNITKNAKNE